MSPITPVICCGVKATTRQGRVCILDYFFIQHLHPHFPNLSGNLKELPCSLLTFEANLLLPVRVTEALLFQYGRDFSLCVRGCLYPVNVDVDKELLKKTVWNQLKPPSKKMQVLPMFTGRRIHYTPALMLLLLWLYVPM